MSTTAAPTRTARLQRLLQQLSDDEDKDGNQASLSSSGVQSSKTVPEIDGEVWRREFNLYVDTLDHLGERSIVEWWGVCIVTQSLYGLGHVANLLYVHR